MHDLLRQGRRFLIVGVVQLAVDWLVFVLLTAAGLGVPAGNVLGRVSGACVGFWLNGRYTFSEGGQARLGVRRFLRFTLVWLALTALSTVAVSAVGTQLGLAWAWLAKPLVEGALAVLAFFLWRHLVYR